MKVAIKEVQVLNFLSIALTVYNLFTLSFNSFFVSLMIALAFYFFTKSQVLFVSILIVPQFLRFVNGLISGKKEKFMTASPEEVIENLKKMKTPTESFVDLKEVSDRIISLKNDSKVLPVERLSALVDQSIMPTVDSIAFLEQFENRTDLNENTRIMTIPENAVPSVGTVEKNARAMVAVEPFDSQAVNTALVRTTNTRKPVSSELESIEISRDGKA